MWSPLHLVLNVIKGFPDLPKFEAQLVYHEAVENKDHETINQLKREWTVLRRPMDWDIDDRIEDSEFKSK